MDLSMGALRIASVTLTVLGILAGNGKAAEPGNPLAVEGGIRTEYLSSSVSGKSKVDTLYATETVQASALDMGLRYRPTGRLSARADFRFHQDWRALAGGKGGVAALRWLGADGRLGENVSFQAGDFRRRYTPLILWAPGPELLEEPDAFARRRGEIMDERMLEIPDRNLQGAEVRFAKSRGGPGFAGFLSDLRLDAVGTRLRRAEYLDPDGAQGFGLDRSDMDRFFLGIGGEAAIRGRFVLGAGNYRLVDDRSSYETFQLSPATRKAVLGNGPNPGTSLNGRDSVLSRNLSITGAHARLDLAGLLGGPGRILEAGAEFAQSSETGRMAWGFRADSSGGTPRNVPFQAPVPGTKDAAFHGSIAAGWRDPEAGSGIRAEGGYISNGKGFLNPLAQTPAFAPARILNTENDPDGSALYTVFDALYNGVYQFTPSRRTAGHHRASYQKNAYHAGAWAPEDLASFRPDPVVQMELPFGLATPNRIGYTARLEASWKDAARLTLSGARLREGQGAGSGGLLSPAARFSMEASGLRLEMHRLLPALAPLSVNGSITRRSAETPGSAEAPGGHLVSARLLMAGARLQAGARWALIAGWQSARLEQPVVRPSADGSKVTTLLPYLRQETQGFLKAGVEYALTAEASLQLSAGRMGLDFEETPAGGPVGAGVAADGGFRQTMAHALVNMRF